MLKYPAVVRRLSLRRDLMLLVLVCVLPVTFVSALVTYFSYLQQRESVEQQTELIARAVLADLEREIFTIESGLKVLATSNELSTGDLRAFHQRARDALRSGAVHNYILTDPQGRQVVNTLLPYGTPLPTSGTPVALGRVFDDRATVLTDMFMAPVAKKLGIAMGVPVGDADKVIFSLNVGVDPVRIQALISALALPEGWLVAVIDGSGTIIGRSRDAERFVGQKAVPEIVDVLAKGGQGRIESVTKEGVPVVTAYVTSASWKWGVVVGVPKNVLSRDVMTQFASVLVAMLAVLGVGLWLARTISTRVLSSVRELNDAAISLGKGERVYLPAMQLQEAEAVGKAIEQAALSMQKVKFLAQHDTLTELPNRLLFEEVAHHNLAFAQRRGQTLAVLAVDLDGFKGVNDNLGHSAGDDVLRMVAQRIAHTIRGSDIVARMGGDEFLIMLTDVDRESAIETAERIVAVLSESYPGVELPVSASVGVALYPLCGSNLTELSAAADRALYRAKQEGKRRAVLAEPGKS
ncbi:MAG TPA: sensor domain-containing diguanylate cyclase [Rhodoferax sp.]|jgi:diguanylate cyclase (GGDEF)-like protein|nr:sensor domain-containing diguanylate cyclase [Rhodoferax sp.]HPW85458.1 sensor domain-containing diguanylate cyclase [Rhodoferax sp.]HQC87223.1 sensor domain-containing diguanylate cyclase [Rhodoferax sp.]